MTRRALRNILLLLAGVLNVATLLFIPADLALAFARGWTVFWVGVFLGYLLRGLQGESDG